MAESPSSALPGGVQWLPAIGGALLLRAEVGRGEPPALILESARGGEHRIEPGPQTRFNRSADFLVPAGLRWSVAKLVWPDGTRAALPGPPAGRAEVIDLASRRPALPEPAPAKTVGPEPLPWTAPPWKDVSDAAEAADGYETARADLEADLTRAAEAIPHAFETERATGDDVDAILSGARADRHAESAAGAADLGVLAAETQLADLRAELDRALGEITYLRTALETERVARVAAEAALGTPVAPGDLTELASEQVSAAATAARRPTEESDRLVAALEAAASSLRATIPPPAVAGRTARPVPWKTPTGAVAASATTPSTTLPSDEVPPLSLNDEPAAAPPAPVSSGDRPAVAPPVGDVVAPATTPARSSDDEPAAAPSAGEAVAWPTEPVLSSSERAAAPPPPPAGEAVALPDEPAMTSFADKAAASSTDEAAELPLPPVSSGDEPAVVPATAVPGSDAAAGLPREAVPPAPATTFLALDTALSGVGLSARATAPGVPPTPPVVAPAGLAARRIGSSAPAVDHRPVIVGTAAARAAAETARATLAPVMMPAPGLRRALLALAREDPVAAGALIAGLLPAQSAVLDGPLSYDLTVRGYGTFAVTVGHGGTEVQRLTRRRSRKEAAFHLSGEPAVLAELLAGERKRLGRFRPSARITGRRKRAKALRPLPESSIGLAEAVRAGARLEPGLVYAALPYAISPEWTRGHVFTIAQEISELSPRAWYVTARDGVRLGVVEHATGAAADATVTMSRAAFDRILKGDPPAHDDRPLIRGDHTAVATLKRWTDLARG